ncbi:HU family DNA-binding protein [Deinococcus hopiensis]|uniref:DNA-binding protein HU-beta n=1 Tax=Deinococcus hopiensis KR-140 TaxID=695939 RepID=A0A1W1URS8_9DEIO|nr:HU family DNA-binding protein [Deinococcus hopiensis]SMB83424.1 DNA-binding protein HU-beta [Deinococcus hopiensis KR-140]
MTKKSTKAPAKKTAAKAAPKAEPAPKAEAAPAKSTKVAKTQLVEQVAQKTGLTKKQADQAVNAFMEIVVQGVQKGQSIGLPGLGTFSVKATAARTGVRPGTSDRIQIPAGKKVSFKVASTLKGTLGDAE